MTELANKIKNLKGYQIPNYPFVPEGTWNMSVCGPFMWMGRQRSGVETDGITRALCYQLRSLVLMYEKLIDYAALKGADVTELKELLEQAWRHLLFSEVSDSSGWTPWLVEVQYTASEVANAKKILAQIMDKLKGILAFTPNTNYRIDTKTGKVETVDNKKYDQGVGSFSPVPVAVRAGQTVSSIVKLNDNLYRLNLKCERPADGAVEIVFDTASDGLFYSAGAGEDVAVQIPTDLKHDPAFALSNGFIYLGNGYSLVKDCSVEHLAATWKMKEKKLVFREELNEDNKEMNMCFYIVKGDVNKGLELGNRLNTWPLFNVSISDNKLLYEKVMPEAF